MQGCYTVCLVRPVAYLPSASGITQPDLPAYLQVALLHSSHSVHIHLSFYRHDPGTDRIVK